MLYSINLLFTVMTFNPPSTTNFLLSMTMEILYYDSPFVMVEMLTNDYGIMFFINYI